MRPVDLARLLFLAALWGSSFIFLRTAAPYLGTVPSAFFRVSLGMLGLLAVVLSLRVPLRFHGKLRHALLLGVLSSAAPFLMYAFAAQRLPAGYSAIFNAMTPLMGVLIGALCFGERATLARLAGVCVGLMGVAVLTQAGPVAVEARMLAGVGACLVATLCYALGGFMTRRWITERGGLDNRLMALGSQVGAVLALLPFMLHASLGDAPPGWLDAPLNAWLAMLGLGLLCTSYAYIVFFRLLADIGPLKATTVTFIIPIFGVLWDWLIFDEPVTLAHLGSTGLIAVALWLVLRGSPQVAAASAAAERKD